MVGWGGQQTRKKRQSQPERKMSMCASGVAVTKVVMLVSRSIEVTSFQCLGLRVVR